nr:MBG domain-containing protein [uncultured Acetobacterium sp.]
MGGIVNGDSLAYTLDRADGETVGTYAITAAVKAEENPNYSITVTENSLSITPATGNVATAPAVTAVYDGKGHVLTPGASIEGSTPMYSVNGGTTWTETAPSYTDVGVYPVLVKVTNPNYADSPAVESSISITKAPATIVIDSKTKVFGTTDPALTAVVGGIVNGDSLAYTLDRADGETVGTYAITAAVKAEENPNYSITVTENSLSITPATGNVATAPAVTAVYDGKGHVLTPGASIEGSTPMYSVNGGTTWTETAPSYTDVGVYPVLVKVTNPNYADSPAVESSISITKAPATIVIDSKTKVFGTTDPALTAVVGGIVNGDSLAYTLDRADGETVGTYAITAAVKAEENPNYSITVTENSLSITPATGNVATAPAVTAVYDGKGHVLTPGASIEGSTPMYSVNGGTTWTETAPSYTDVGVYPVLVKVTNPNYADSPAVESSISITKAPATIVIDSKTKVFGTTDPALTAVVGGIVNGDSLAYTLDRADGETVGTYAITAAVKAEENPNYSITVTENSLSITPATGNVATAPAVTAVYDGKGHVLTPGASIEGSTPMYSVNGGTTWTETAPSYTDVGVYPVLVKVTNPNYADSPAVESSISITKAPATIVIDSKTKVFGTTDPALTAVVGGIVNGDSLAYTLDRADGETVGTYAITAAVKAEENPNYSITVTENSLSITPATGNVATAPAVTAVYDGKGHVLTPGASIEGSTPMYSVNGGTTWTETAPSYTDVGVYPVLVKVTNPNYADSPAVESSISITKAPATIVIDSKTKVFGTTDPALTAVVGGIVNGDSLAYTLDRADGETVGTYAITAAVKAEENPNYSITVTENSLSITPATGNVATAPAVTAVYDGKGHVLTPGASIEGSTPMYSVNGGTTWTETAPSYTDVGVYPVLVKVTNPNYADSPAVESSISITKAPATIVIDSKTKVFGTTDPALTAVVGGIVNGDSLAYTLDRADGETVGTYAITAAVKAEENPNYSITVTENSLSITPATGNVATAPAVTAVYDGKGHVLTPGASIEGSTPMYSVNGGTTWTETAPSYTDVGVYPVLVKVTNPNYADSPAVESSISITKAPATIVIDSKTKVFGTTDPALTAVVGGIVNGDSLAYTLDRADGETVGTYAITAAVKAEENPNYSITVTENSLSITPATGNVATAPAVTAVYDGKGHVLTPGASIEGSTPMYSVNGGTTWTETAPSYTDVGVYPVLVKVTNPNYADSPAVESSISITKAPATIVIDSKTKVFGTTDPALTAVVGGIVNGDSLAYTLDRADGETVGTYAITAAVKAEENPNYSITVTENSLSITPATGNVATAPAVTAVYDGKGHVLTPGASIEGSTPMYSVNGGTTWTETAPSYTDVGVYPVLVKVTNPNYADSPAVESSISITKAPATIVIDSKTKVFGTTDPALTAVVGGIVNGDSLAYDVGY